MEKIQLIGIPLFIITGTILVFMVSTSLIASTVPDVTSARIAMSMPTTKDYQYVVIETCARNYELVKPDVFVSSDMGEKTIRLGEGLKIGQCAFTGAEINAKNIHSVSLTIVSEDTGKPMVKPFVRSA